MKILAFTSILAVFLFSCNKEKRYSKKLIKGETWSVESISVDGTSLNTNSTWFVKGDDIYETVSQVEWNPGNANNANFEWQFKEKGKKWVLNYLQNCEECDGNLTDELDYLAYNLSGTYTVEKHKRKEMIFTSTETQQYANQKVEIKLVRE